jgi:hypothetical protein
MITAFNIFETLMNADKMMLDLSCCFNPIRSAFIYVFICVNLRSKNSI